MKCPKCGHEFDTAQSRYVKRNRAKINAYMREYKRRRRQAEKAAQDPGKGGAA